MPQAIAMQLPATAAAMPTAAVALAPAGSATGKAPVFAGLLSQFGRIASPLGRSAGDPAVARQSSSPAAPGESPAQPEPPGTGVADHAAPTPDADLLSPLPTVTPTIPTTLPGSGLPGMAASDLPNMPGSGLPDLPASLVPVVPAPASGLATGLPFIVGAHPNTPRDPAVTAATANASDVVASTSVTPLPVPAKPPPPNATEPLRLRRTPADSQVERTRLDAVGANPGPPTCEPPGSAAAISATAASPGWSSAPAAAATTETATPLVQPLLATAQPVQLAAPAQVPDRVDAASPPPPDSTATGPAQQVSAALVSLAGTPGGGQRMTLRLEPAELGQVQIRIDRPQDAPAQVEITVQRPETLTLLLRDQPQLQRALDQAGVPADGRSLTMHVAAPQSAASSGSVHSGATASADLGQSGGNGAGTRSGGRAARETRRRRSRTTRWHH